MISLQKRFLFVHIPKTGGNSVQSVLQQYSEDEVVTFREAQDGVGRFGLRNPIYNLKKHSKLSAYRDALGKKQFRELYKFTCIRNPWDRMISFYFSPSRELSDWDRATFIDLISKARPAADYLRLEKGETNPYSNVDRIMRFENLAEDFRTICGELDIPAAPLPRHNPSKRDHYWKYYDDELRDMVAQRFASDIEQFGYAFK